MFLILLFRKHTFDLCGAHYVLLEILELAFCMNHDFTKKSIRKEKNAEILGFSNTCQAARKRHS